MSITISGLPHTWLIDLDGTILRHNGHKEGKETLLPGVIEFWRKIPKEDRAILLSARDVAYKEDTLNFLSGFDLWWSDVLFGLPVGERIIINDKKPSGLPAAIAINVDRDVGLHDLFNVDPRY